MPPTRPPYRAAQSRGRYPAGARRRWIALAACLLALLLLAWVATQAAREYTARMLRAELIGLPYTPDVAALGAGAIVGPPSISSARARAVLDAYGSPAAADAEYLHERGLAYGIDPAYCLAFFVMESRAGTRGIATLTHSVGNIRARPGEAEIHGFRLYATWRDGIEDWYRLMSRVYIGELGLTTVDEIVPVYAPATDNNDPVGYARTIKTLVAIWRDL